jgi:hypothetical protein
MDCVKFSSHRLHQPQCYTSRIEPDSPSERGENIRRWRSIFCLLNWFEAAVKITNNSPKLNRPGIIQEWRAAIKLFYDMFRMTEICPKTRKKALLVG